MAEKKYDFKTHNCHHFAERLCLAIGNLNLEFIERFKEGLRRDNLLDGSSDWAWLNDTRDFGNPLTNLPNFFRSLRNTFGSR